jgi:hypothetical protein
MRKIVPLSERWIISLKIDSVFSDCLPMNFKLFFIVWLIPSLAISQSIPCHLKKEKDGIKVYTCKTSGERFRMVRAVFELESTSLEKLENFLWDVDNYVNWQYRSIAAELLDKANSNEMTYRVEVDAPWPVENRELILNFKIKRDSLPNRLDIEIHSTRWDQPPPQGMVRVPYSKAVWLILKEGTSLKIDYWLQIDPGGLVPAWIVNMALADGPLETFKKLKDQVALRE